MRIRHDRAANEEIRAFDQGEQTAAQDAVDGVEMSNRQLQGAWGDNAGLDGHLATSKIAYERGMEELGQMQADLRADTQSIDIQDQTASRAIQRCAPR